MKKFLASCAALGLAAVMAQPVMADNTPGTDSAVASAFSGVTSQHYTVYVLPGGMGFMGPGNKNHHDTIAPSNFVLKVGVPVTFTVVNFDDGGHSITSAGLGVNIIINPGTDEADGSIKPTVTTYTFTPTKKGQFHWNCIIKCDGPSHWAMSMAPDGMAGRDGYMGGWFQVL